jgi:hypothetical protein
MLAYKDFWIPLLKLFVIKTPVRNRSADEEKSQDTLQEWNYDLFPRLCEEIAW